MFIEGIAMSNSLNRLTQGAPPHQQIGYQINQQQLPDRELKAFLDDGSSNKQHHRGNNQCYFSFRPTLLMMMVVMIMSMATAMPFLFVHITVAAAMMVFVMMMCHICNFF